MKSLNGALEIKEDATGMAGLIEVLKWRFGGKGGGSKTIANYSLPEGVSLDECLEFCREVLSLCAR